VIADTRAASVVTMFLSGAQPDVWVADRYGGQLGHGAARQIGLTYLLRAATYASEDGDGGFAPGFRLLVLRAMAIGKQRAGLQDSTLAQYRAGVERRLDQLLSGPMPERPAARRLFCPMRRDRDDLPQGDGRVPRRVGRQGLCRSRQRHRRRALAWTDRGPARRARSAARYGCLHV